MTTSDKPTAVQNLMNISRHRYSLTAILTSALLFVLILFITITALAYYRLSGFQLILSEITSRSLPSVVASGRLFGQVQELAFLTEGLSHANSPVSRRIVHQAIQNKITEITATARESHNGDYQLAQLDMALQELNDLNTLVEQRLQIQEVVEKQQEAVHSLHEEVFSFTTHLLNNNKVDGYVWALKFSEVVVLVDKSLSTTKLHNIRQTKVQIQQFFEENQRQLAGLPKDIRDNATEFSERLHTLLLSDQGLLPLQAEQLRIIGRTQGRANFVRNLVLHYATVAEYELQELSDAILDDTLLTAERVKRQTQIMGVISIVAIFCLISIILFIQRQIVHRLALLNKNVLTQLHGEKISISIRGNDEISDIARSFEYFARKVDDQTHELQQLSFTDSLTDVANRRSFDDRLAHDLQTARRYKWPISLLLIDLDFFKLYNDNYGHLAGDDCLRTVASLLKQSLQRDNDFVARYGGEEFVCILPDTDRAGAERMAIRMLNTISTAAIPHVFSKAAPHITISIGIISTQVDETLLDNALLEKADQALYEAKRNGKNGYVVYTPPGS